MREGCLRIKRERGEKKERKKKKFNLTTCYSKVVCLQPYYSQLPIFFRNTNPDEASFWLMRMKKFSLTKVKIEEYYRQVKPKIVTLFEIVPYKLLLMNSLSFTSNLISLQRVKICSQLKLFTTVKRICFRCKAVLQSGISGTQKQNSLAVRNPKHLKTKQSSGQESQA